MAKRRTELSTDVVMNFRINAKMKEKIDTQADMAGVSSAEWMRRVLNEKLDSIDYNDRVSSGAQSASDVGDHSELRECVRSILIELLHEEKR